MIRGITFADQIITAQDDAHCRNIFLNSAAGVTKGCEVSYSENQIGISEGYFVIYGRFVNVVGKETIAVEPLESGNIYCRLVFEIDLNETNTTEEFNQCKFKVIKDLADYPSVMQEDLDAEGKVYQLSFAKFINTTSGISAFEREIANININQLWSDLASNYNAITSDFSEYYNSHKAEAEENITKGFMNYYSMITTMKNEISSLFSNYESNVNVYSYRLQQKIAEYESQGFASQTELYNRVNQMIGVTTEFKEDGSVVEISDIGRKETQFLSNGAIREIMRYNDGGQIMKFIVILDNGTVKETISELG